MGKTSKVTAAKSTASAPDRSYLNVSKMKPSSTNPFQPLVDDSRTVDSISNVTPRDSLDPTTVNTPSAPTQHSSTDDRIDRLTGVIEKLSTEVASVTTTMAIMRTDVNILQSQQPPKIGSYASFGSSRPSSRQSNHGHSSPTSPLSSPPSNQFNQNEFSVATNGCKIKFDSMESYLAKKSLPDDTASSIQSLYGHITRSISIAFSQHIQIMPSFRKLTKDISFEKLFLSGLVGQTLNSCQGTFDHIGDLIKDFLLCDTTISHKKCPNALTVVTANRFLTGWNILEILLQSRLAICGAEPDLSLDNQLTSLTFQDGESLQHFYIKTQTLLNEFYFQSSNEQFVPAPKIMKKYLLELSRSQTYFTVIITFHRRLSAHVQQYGIDNNVCKLDFDLKAVYDDLILMGVPTIPTSLAPQVPLEGDIMVNDPYRPTHSTNPPNAHIANFESSIQIQPNIDSPYLEDDVEPEISAQFSSRKRCQTCLIGFHSENDCYLRGNNFQPPELRRRIKIYNQVHGDSPPSGHTIRPWNPPTIEPIHKNATNNDSQGKKPPFANSSSKTGKQEIRSLETTIHNPIPDPAMSAFLADQSKYENEDLLEYKDHDTTCPIICSARRNNHPDEAKTNPDDFVGQTNVTQNLSGFLHRRHTQLLNRSQPTIRSVDQIPNKNMLVPRISSFDRPDDYAANGLNHDLHNQPLHTKTSATVSGNTPPTVLQVVNKAHSKICYPRKHFLQYQAKSISQLSNTSFDSFGNMTFHIDSGANCCSVRDKSVFYFFVASPSTVKTVAGTSIPCQGWGTILLRFNSKVYLVGPVYYCPDNPTNTISPGAMKNYCHFKSINITINEYMDCTDLASTSFKIKFTVFNDLDYATFEIVTFKPQPILASQVQVVRRSPRLHDISEIIPPSDPPTRRSKRIAMKATPTPNSLVAPVSLSKQNVQLVSRKLQSPPTLQRDHLVILRDQDYHTKNSTFPTELTITKSVFSCIAAYYVQLHPSSSPRTVAISTMNQVLGLPPARGTLQNPTTTTYQTCQTPDQDPVFLPVIANFSRASTRNLSLHQHWLLLHSGAMHTSSSTLQHVIKKQLLTDIHPTLLTNPTYDCQCRICKLTKPTLIPRGKLVDKTDLAPFQRIHVDFSFFSVESIRGFTTGLDVTCASTSYPFAFPSKSKSPPVDILQWLLSSLRTLGFQINFIRVDEGGELAGSSIFTKFVCENSCILETTGGGNSALNGIVERGNRTIADMTRAELSVMNIIMHKDLPLDLPISKFWCFAYSHTPHVRRRMYHRIKKDIPYFLVHKKRPSARDLVPLGSIMTVIDPHKNNHPKLSPTRTIKGYFMGYSNHTKVRLYWSPDTPTTIKRSSHCVIEDVETMKILEPSFIATDSDATSISEDSLFVQDSDIDTMTSPFPPDQVHTISLLLPPRSSKLGFVFKNDLSVNLPYLEKTLAYSFAHNSVPSKLRNNHYVLSINDIDYLTAAQCSDALRLIQQSNERVAIIEFTHRSIGDTTTAILKHRAMFDQIPSPFHHKPVISSLAQTNYQTLQHINKQIVSHDPVYTHFITSASKPVRPNSFFEALKSPYRMNWKAAAWTQFKKNHKIVVFSLPFKSTDLPTQSRVFRSQLVCEIKDTDAPGIFELKVRDVIVGTPQQKYLDYDDSYAPVIDPCTIKVQLSLTCGRNYILAVIDVKNAFQNTIANPKSRIYTTVPPTYLEFLCVTEGFEYNTSVKYYRQMFNSNQGTRDAGNLWYCLIRGVLEKFGFIRSTVDHAFFVKALANNNHFYVSVATDDLLCSFPSWDVFTDFKSYLLQYFELSIQTGSVLKFLGIRIIQSDLCITMDQAEYTYNMLEHYFGTSVDKVKTHTTPLRYDTDFEKELYDSLPLLPEELKNASIKFKGPYRFWIGKLLFLSVQTRFDIGFSVQRLSEYNVSPTLKAFEGIIHLLRYLAGDVLRPLTFPKSTFQGTNTISWFATPTQKYEITVSNAPTLFFDAEFAKDAATRHSYYCNIITVFNVAILFKVKKTSTIMLHTTDAEMKGGASGVQQLQPIRRLFEFCGFPLPEPSDAYTDNAAVHSIVESGKMTPRCRHIDIPIALMHQEHGRSYHLHLIRTMVMLADMGTKVNTPKYHRLFKHWICGSQYLPPKHHSHFDLLQLEFYERNFAIIMKSYYGD